MYKTTAPTDIHSASMNKQTITATLLALLACAIWSGSFVIARGVIDQIPPITLAFWRWLVALITILPIGYLHLKSEWPIVKAHWKYIVGMGILGVATFNTLVYISAHYTTAHHIALISSTAPIGTLVLAGAMGLERLSRYKIGGAICALLGTLIIITHGEIQHILKQEWNNGDLILIGTACIWAGWSVALLYKPKNMSSRTFLTSIIAVGVISLIPFYTWEATHVAPTPFTWQAWSIYLYIGIASSVIAWFCWQYAVETIGSVKTSLLYYSLPIFSGALAIITLGEPLETYHVIGFILVCGGIFVSNLRKLGIVKQ